MKKLMIILTMLLLISCSDSKNSLYESLTMKESDVEILQMKNEIIKDLLSKDETIKKDFDSVNDHLNQITFESLTGSQSGTSAIVRGDLRLDLNDGLYYSQFEMLLEGEALVSFELDNHLLETDKVFNLFDIDLLEGYTRLDKENKTIIIEKNNQSYAYRLDDLINYEVKKTFYNLIDQTYVETVELYFVNSMLSSNFDVEVTFDVSNEEISISHIDTKLSRLKVTPLVNLSGRWGVPFRLEPLYTDFGVLVINDYDGESVSYSGRMFLYSWQIKADHVNNMDIYDVTLEYNFSEESIRVIAGEKTQSVTEDPGLEFLITKATSDLLVSEPVNWTNITRYPLDFSKKFDTISILNNKQVMLKTVAESDDKSTISHD